MLIDISEVVILHLITKIILQNGSKMVSNVCIASSVCTSNTQRKFHKDYVHESNTEAGLSIFTLVCLSSYASATKCCV